MADAPAADPELPMPPVPRSAQAVALSHPSSLIALWRVLGKRRRSVLVVMGGCLATCLIYCVIAPKQYESTARVALRTSAPTSLRVDGESEAVSRQFASGDVQAETLANEFRSSQLAWRVITKLQMYRTAAFAGDFGTRYPDFKVQTPSVESQAYLLDRFQKRLLVKTLPRTLILEVRFRSGDPALSALVANTLIQEYVQQDTEGRVRATTESTAWLNVQLDLLKARVAADDRRLTSFQQEHGLVDTPLMMANGQPGEAQHNTALLQIDELGHELAAATSNRILREAQYRAAASGNPEFVLASDPGLQSQNGGFATALLQQLHARQSDLQQEASQLSTEHGPSFPRAVEIRAQLADLEKQIASEDGKLTQRFKDAWTTARDREQLVRQSLEESTREGMKLNEAAAQYVVMRQEADRNHELYMNVLAKAEEAGLTAGVHDSKIAVVDAARQPVKAISPDLPVYLALTFFVSLWIAVGGALLMETIDADAARTLAALILGAVLVGVAHGQAPTPSTSGLPTGVAHLPQSSDRKSQPNAKDAPLVWSEQRIEHAGTPIAQGGLAAPASSPIGPGDVLEVSEYRTPEFHATVRVSDEGAVTLALVGEVKVLGLNETEAAREIEKTLQSKGMLLHPHVAVMVTVYVGQDVTILGEVMRPGVYAYTAHHRLLDVISGASGVTTTAGSLVTIDHRDRKAAAEAVVLDGSAGTEHNPELMAGDTVQVSRAGLVYVVGDVMRPGGFPVDPSQHLTVVQALTLAWGPTQSAALTKALLIREQNGGRTITNLNIKRLLRGEDLDLPIHDRDILFVPDSAAKNLWNRTMESVVQSAAGVSIYAGMVYSQRF